MNKKQSKGSINRSDEYKDIIDMMYGKDEIFSTIAELLAFTAYVGLYTKNKLPIPAKKKGEPVITRFFENTNSELHFWSISLFANGTVSSLTDPDQCLQDFEDYSNGGLHYIAKKLNENPTDNQGVETIMTIISKIHADYFSAPKKKNPKKVKF